MLIIYIYDSCIPVVFLIKSIMENTDIVESVSLVTVDHYISNPINGLDSLYSEFWGTQVVKVPVLRVFGTTPEGNSFFLPCGYIKNNCNILIGR